MSVPIPALTVLRPIEAQPRHAGAREALVGELLRLQIVAGAQGQLLGRDAGGLELQLPAGLAAPGDTLLLRVQATQPRLELARVEAGSPLPGTTDAEEGGAALRTDQAWLQRLSLPAARNEAAALAQQWRDRALAEALRLGAAGALAAERAEIAWPLPTTLPAVAAQPLQLPGWGAQALLLQLIVPPTVPGLADAEDDEPAGAPGARPSAALSGLGLLLNLSVDGAPVQLLLQWRHGLLLSLATASPQALLALRESMPRIAAALAAVPLRLRHCRLLARPLAGTPMPPALQSQGLAQPHSALLFRAAAEIAGVLRPA